MRDDENHRTASSLKSQANTLYTKGKYSAAAELYTEALVFSPNGQVLRPDCATFGRHIHVHSAAAKPRAVPPQA